MIMNHNFEKHDIFEDVFGATSTPSPAATGIDGATNLATSDGYKAAREIQVGDQILTFDNGLRTVRSVQKRMTPTQTTSLPIFVPAGAIGNEVDLVVPEHQVLMIENDRAEAMFGDPFVLVRARDLVGYNGISRIVPAQELETVEIEFGNDEVIFGAKGELFFCPVSRETIQHSDIFFEHSGYSILSADMVVKLTPRTDHAPAQNFHKSTPASDAYDLVAQFECRAA